MPPTICTTVSPMFTVTAQTSRASLMPSTPWSCPALILISETIAAVDAQSAAIRLEFIGCMRNRGQDAHKGQARHSVNIQPLRPNLFVRSPDPEGLVGSGGVACSRNRSEEHTSKLN